MRWRILRTLIVANVLLGCCWQASAERLRVLIVDGQNNHQWKLTTPILKDALESCRRFAVDVATSPPAERDLSGFKPKFSDYDVVLSNYNGQPWSQATQNAFVEYVKAGGGFVCVHAANNSFPEWKEYNEIIGLGGWGARNETSGPYVYYNEQGREVRDTSNGPGGGHGPQHAFQIVIRDRSHPITTGMPSAWMHTKDELYDKLRGPAVNMRVLATAYSPTSKGGRDLHEPMMMTVTYGEGRIFHTPMGHAVDSMQCAGFITTLQRGCEWAATGQVTVPIPSDFPTAGSQSIRQDVSKEPRTSAASTRQLSTGLASVSSKHLEIRDGDRICIIGNTLAERMQYFGHFETSLHSRFPYAHLVVRNLGWSADELTLRPRSKDFQDHGHTLTDHQADVVIACFGFNESFRGSAGLGTFKDDLAQFITDFQQAQFNGKSPPRLALVSPIAHESLGEPGLPDGSANNGQIRLYADAMAEVAARHGVAYVDLFTPSRAIMESAVENLTTNGIHLNDRGYQRMAPVLDEGLFGPRPAAANRGLDMGKLRAEILEKNLQFFYDYRAVNGYYIYGGRKEPFGVINFPHEFRKLRKMIGNRDQRIWNVARGEPVSDLIDDDNSGDLPPIETNFTGEIEILPPEEAIEHFTLPEGYEVNLFASEADFPELKNPVQMAFDARGRLWVCVMPSYPMYLPGIPVNDKLLVLEDTDADGKADKLTVFADGLHVPTGFELGDGGVYIAQQPNVVFLKDTDGDGHADEREIVLHGFDSADSHHAISAFTWGPGGGLYFQEGTFHHTSVETPYGPVRNAHGGVYRYEPKTEKFETFIHYNFANPWGHIFDRWGQNFVADASGGANYYGTAFSGKAPQFEGQGDFGPFKFKYRRELKQFITKRVRPTSGCEIVSSGHFPDEAQGWFLLNNCIGEQAVLRHEVSDDGSGFAGKEILPPLLRSSDRNFRPVDLEFGLDGALYVVDWFNPLVGHMQHSLRDPNRDHTHGRIWRVTCKDRPLLDPPRIAEASVPQLLDLLKSYEDRTRYHVRCELRNRETDVVIRETDAWVAGLSEDAPDYPHHLLEALWVHQHHDVINEALLERVLRSPDFRARAAATRVLGYWRDRLTDPIEWLKTQAGDDHPRVALEAVRAASFFQDRAAGQAALSAIKKHGKDDYIRYTLRETLEALKPYMRRT